MTGNTWISLAVSMAVLVFGIGWLYRVVRYAPRVNPGYGGSMICAIYCIGWGLLGLAVVLIWGR